MTLISDFSLQHLLSDVMQCTLTKLTGDTRLGWGRQMPSESLGCHSQWLEEQSSGNFMKFSGDKGEAHSPWRRYRLGMAGQVSSSVGKVLVHSEMCTCQQCPGSRTTACPSMNGIIPLFSVLRRPHLDTVSTSGLLSTGNISINWYKSSEGAQPGYGGAVAL